jgi:hypothetical protein
MDKSIVRIGDKKDGGDYEYNISRIDNMTDNTDFWKICNIINFTDLILIIG